MTFGELAEKLERFTVKRFGQGAQEEDIHDASARLGVRLTAGPGWLEQV
jgi:hypothetical protein